MFRKYFPITFLFWIELKKRKNNEKTNNSNLKLNLLFKKNIQKKLWDLLEMTLECNNLEKFFYQFNESVIKQNEDGNNQRTYFKTTKRNGGICKTNVVFQKNWKK